MTQRVTRTENPAGSPKVKTGLADFKRFEAVLKGVVSVPRDEVEDLKKSGRKKS